MNFRDMSIQGLKSYLLIPLSLEQKENEIALFGNDTAEWREKERRKIANESLVSKLEARRERIVATVAAGLMSAHDYGPGHLINEDEIASDALAITDKIIEGLDKVPE